jgi:glycosyltransferase involved in cell wall biosynthesis
MPLHPLVGPLNYPLSTEPKRLRIAVLSRNFSVTGGGAERYSIAVVEELAARHEIHVFSQTRDHAFPGVVYHRVALPMKRPRWINQLYFAWATWRATRSGFDIVHSHENTWHGNVQTAHVLPIKYTLLKDKQGVALALRWLKVASSPRLLAYLWLEKRRYAFSLKKQVVCASTALKEIFEATYPAAIPMLSVVSPGVGATPGWATDAERLAARKKHGLPQDASLLLFVGNDFVKKGLPRLLSALAKLPEQTHLAVVGNYEGVQDITRLAQLAGLTQRVHFLGSLADMETAYQAADVLVHPTLEDSYGMVVLEAMAHGLPVVVSGAPYSGIAQDLTDGVNAVLLKDPKNVENLAAEIGRLQSDVDFSEKLSKNAAAFAIEHTWVKAASSYDAIAQKITKKYTQRWLVLSHAFNMDGRAASQTITDKLPHLEAAGVELVVLSGVSGRQDTRYEHYRLWPMGPAGIRFELRHVLRKHIASALAYRLVMVLLSLPLLPFMLIEKLLRPVESSWSWWISAYLKGRRLARHRDFDLIYSTGGAFSAHVAARALQKHLGIRWLTEVHDPLVMPGKTPDTPQERMQARIEQVICTKADTAIWFTDQALASAKRRHPQLGERGHVVLPGIDSPFKVMPEYRPAEKMRIGHFGALSATRNLLPMLAAMEQIQKKQPEVFELMELHVYGGPLDAGSKAHLEISNIRDYVKHFGRIEADPVLGLSGRDQILKLMRSMDVLLLLHGNEPICTEYIPSKMYEYLWMQRPILALVCRNPQMESLLAKEGHEVVQVQEEETPSLKMSNQLASALLALYEKWANNNLNDNFRTSPYTTKETVNRMLSFL